LQKELERQPLAEEIAARLDVPLQAVRQALVNSQDVHSLDEELGSSEDGEYCLMDILADRETEQPLDIVERLAERTEIQQSLNDLKPREVEILRRYYGLDGVPEGSLAEIGREMDLSRERVRQIKDIALSRLRLRFETQDYTWDQGEEIELVAS
ncbi:MAG: sigma factor-like helix-turn-helix DNA-binding protein, partial [bacterium]|nr:sigma factor-like helix-turn-helix DNA-binding protein [bacterium]